MLIYGRRFRSVAVPLVPVKERLAAEMKTCPIDRPRSTTPINPSSLEEYVVPGTPGRPGAGAAPAAGRCFVNQPGSGPRPSRLGLGRGLAAYTSPTSRLGVVDGQSGARDSGWGLVHWQRLGSRSNL